jgi:methoxymalonate biosynthesis acyl carrier protein
MKDLENIRAQLRNFIEQRFSLISESKINFNDQDNIFHLGIVNSMFAMQLLKQVENIANIRCSREELKMENFCCIDKMMYLITRKLSNV